MWTPHAARARRVADKLGRGDYTPADLEELRRFEHETARAPDAARPRPMTSPGCTPRGTRSGRTRSPRTAPASATSSSRPSSWLRRLARPVAAVTLARQAEFNGAVARLLTGASRGVQSLEAGNDALLRRLDELERRNLELHARCEELQAEVRGLQARLEPDGRAVKPG